MFVRPSVWNNSAPTGRIFIPFYIWVFPESQSRKLKLHWCLTIITGTLREDQYTFMIVSPQFFSEWKMFQTKVVEKIKTHFIFYNLFFPEILSFLWVNVERNMVEPDRPQMTVRRVRIACWIPKATNTYSENVIRTVFPLQYWLQEHASMLR